MTVAPLRIATHHGLVVSASLFSEIAEDDGWTCWLCGGDVDPSVRAGPWMGTADHVMPRVRRGATAPSNLRLAHRGCNTRRGSADPVVEWPPDLPVHDTQPLFPTAVRLASAVAKRTGQPDQLLAAALAATRDAREEIVGFVDPVTAPAAARWLVVRVTQMFRGEWSVRLDGDAALQALVLCCERAPEVVPATRR